MTDVETATALGSLDVPAGGAMHGAVTVTYSGLVTASYRTASRARTVMTVKGVAVAAAAIWVVTVTVDITTETETCAPFWLPLLSLSPSAAPSR